MATAFVVAHLISHELPMLCLCVWGACKFLVGRRATHVCHDHEES